MGEASSTRSRSYDFQTTRDGRKAVSLAFQAVLALSLRRLSGE